MKHALSPPFDFAQSGCVIYQSEQPNPSWPSAGVSRPGPATPRNSLPFPLDLRWLSAVARQSFKLYWISGVPQNRRMTPALPA
jgi:hypothetical protein